MEDLKVLHDHAVEAAQSAGRRAERLRVAPAAGRANPAHVPDRADEDAGAHDRGARPDERLAPAGSVPTFDPVREKIDRRYARALGRAELGASAVEATVIEVERAHAGGRGGAGTRFPSGQPEPPAGGLLAARRDPARWATVRRVRRTHGSHHVRSDLWIPLTTGRRLLLYACQGSLSYRPVSGGATSRSIRPRSPAWRVGEHPVPSRPRKRAEDLAPGPGDP
jgi:hypothetical protein